MAQAHLTPAGPATVSHQGLVGRVPVYRALVWAGMAMVGVLIALMSFASSEPSPYDFLAVPTIGLWLLLGLRLPREALFFVALLFVYLLGFLLATIPYLDRPVSVWWTAISAYLVATAVFFAMFFSDDTRRRIELAFTAFLVSCLIAATAGIMGYFDLFGTGDLFGELGRASGTFKDPNVLGSFLVPGLLIVLRDLLTGEGRPRLLAFAILPILLAGTFLSFSRGAWAATLLGTTVLLAVTFATTRSAQVRRRIVLLGLAGLVVGAIGIAALLANDEVRAMFEVRAQVTQSYDEGETGRFGNQLRAIPRLMDHPNGLGPLRYRLLFGFDPHSSYLSAFANGGWVTGFAFVAMMVTTAYVGWRLSVEPSPYQRQAQIVWAAHLTLCLQSFQIDIDHWRHIYLIWGMIWGLRVAQMRYLGAQRQMMPSQGAGFGPAGQGALGGR